MAVIDGKAWREALMVFGRMSGWVATPILVAVFLGRWLDKQKGTEDFWFFVMIGAGFFVSIIGIYRESKKYQRSLEKQDKLEQEQKNGNTSHE